MTPLYGFDTETTIRAIKTADGKTEHTAAPEMGARVVLSSVSSDKGASVYDGLEAWDRLSKKAGKVCIVGHNLTFDLGHVLWERSLDGLRWLLDPRVTLWDTQIADYLIQACAVQSPSLEATGARYGIHVDKDEWASAAFAEGRGADELLKEDPERLRRYARNDTVKVLQIAHAQRAHIVEHCPELRPVLRVQMQALKLVILCQHFGMPFDLLVLKELSRQADDALAIVNVELQRAIHALINDPLARAEFNPGSPAHLKALLYGGELKLEQREQIGVFKTGKKLGQPRYRVHEHIVTLPGVARGASKERTTKKHVIKYLATIESLGPDVQTFLQKLLEFRKLEKLNGTYHIPLALQASLAEDNRLHGGIHMAVTNTGRKSSSGPNLQNLPPSVRAAIAAKRGWRIISADFKQLEVIALAYMSGCEKLRAALLAGKDIHGMIKRRVDKRTGRAIERTNVKRIVFGRFYGGGPETLAGQSGVPVEIVQEVLDALDSLFPGAANMARIVEPSLKKSRRPVPSATGIPEYEALHTLPSGRRLAFRTENGRWPYTEMKNRPIQSLATADFVPYAEQSFVGWLWRNFDLLENNLLRVIVVAHDEIVFEVHESAVERLAGFLVELSDTIVAGINATYRLSPPLDLPLAIEAAMGNSWKDAKDDANKWKYREAA